MSQGHYSIKQTDTDSDYVPSSDDSDVNSDDSDDNTDRCLELPTSPKKSKF